MQLATSGFFVFGQPIVSLEKRREISHLPQRLIFLLLVVDQVLGSLDSLFLQKFKIKIYFFFLRQMFVPGRRNPSSCRPRPPSSRPSPCTPDGEKKKSVNVTTIDQILRRPEGWEIDFFFFFSSVREIECVGRRKGVLTMATLYPRKKKGKLEIETHYCCYGFPVYLFRRKFI